MRKMFLVALQNIRRHISSNKRRNIKSKANTSGTESSNCKDTKKFIHFHTDLQIQHNLLSSPVRQEAHQSQ